jgi:kynurenine formamidase
MPTEAELRGLAEQVSNWGRWGADDALGTLNHLTADRVRDAAGLVRRGAVFSLGLDIDERGIWEGSTFRRNPIHLMTVDGGDVDLKRHLASWDGPGSSVLAASWGRHLARYNDDYIIMPLQASTQWDALSHVYYDGLMYNGVEASAVTSQGATRHGIERLARGIAGRGVLIDVARARGIEHLPPNEPVEIEELDAVLSRQDVQLRGGDIVLVRTGWWPQFAVLRDPGRWRAGCPGLSWRTAAWLAEHDVAAVAADNTAVEVTRTQYAEDDQSMPLHMLCLRDMGMPFGELWNLEELAADCATDGVYEFQLVAPPLRVTGGVGSPLNPLAIK